MSEESGSKKSNPIVAKRQTENEAVFRAANEKTIKELEQFNDLAKGEREHRLTTAKETVLHFICECSDEDCSERIPMSINDYEKFHEDRNFFIVAKNHEVNEIEKTILKKNKFSLVKKLLKPPSKNLKLKSTPTKNV